MFLSKSKEYEEGWKAGEEGAGEFENPYFDNASEHNLENGMRASPWWATNYEPFLEWERGCLEARHSWWLKSTRNSLWVKSKQSPN